MSKFVTSIDKSGPFFSKDPRLTFRQNVRVMMDAVAAEGQKDVQTQLRAGQAGRLALGLGLGRVSDHVVGRTSSISGKRWQVTAVVGVTAAGLDAKRAVKVMAAGSYLEGQGHAVRRTSGRLRSSRAVNQAELLKGLQ